MKRRIVLGTSSLLLAGPTAFAQPARKVYRIGVLVTASASEWSFPQPVNLLAKALQRGLGELGYIHGQHYLIEPRGAEGNPARFPVLAAELVTSGTDVIVVSGPGCTAVKAATSTIPVVMTAALDPLAEGLVQSLSRSGNNLTGLSHQFGDLIGKLLELLKELVPGPAPVAVLWDRAGRSTWEAAQLAARSRGWKLHSLEIKDANEIEPALKSAHDARAGALLVLTGYSSFPNRRRIAELALQHRLPSMYDLRPYVDAGGLMSYGADLVDIWRQAARYVDKIVKGAKPTDLPIEQPTRIELVLNLKTAKALGMTVPAAFRLRVDELIE